MPEPLQAAIALLNNPVATLTDIQWTVLREVSHILKSFQVVTTEMSGDKYITVSKVIMLAHGFSSVCTKIKTTVTTQLANGLVEHALGRLSRKQHGACHCHVPRSTLQKECVSISKQLLAGQGSGNCRSGQVVRRLRSTATSKI